MTADAVGAAFVDGLDRTALAAGVREALDDRLDVLDDHGGRDVLVAPDVHYPFHPSTGLVTNPDLVAALLSVLGEAGYDPVLGTAGSPLLDLSPAALLGYETIAAAAGVDVVELAGDGVERRADGALDGRAVVAVPTLRTTGADGRSGAAALDTASSPALTLLDGTYTYAGEPRRSLFVLGSADATAVGRLVGQLLAGEGATRDDGTRAALAGRLPDAIETDDGGTADASGAMAAGYRLYARATGDLVPPQFLPGGE